MKQNPWSQASSIALVLLLLFSSVPAAFADEAAAPDGGTATSPAEGTAEPAASNPDNHKISDRIKGEDGEIDPDDEILDLADEPPHDALLQTDAPEPQPNPLAAALSGSAIAATTPPELSFKADNEALAGARLLKMDGNEYATNLFTGAASYSYSIDVPDGIHGLEPDVVLQYNHQAARAMPIALGAGWSMPVPAIIRDINHTLANTSDDQFMLLMDGVNDNLVSSSDGRYHTEKERFYLIERRSGAPNSLGEYWTVKTKDGTTYRFGFTSDSELASNIAGTSQISQWKLDQVEDTFGNKIKYAYYDNSDNEQGISHLSTIFYNNDQVAISFVYSPGQVSPLTSLPLSRESNSNGIHIKTTWVLTNIKIYIQGAYAKEYSLNYTQDYGTRLLTSIKEIGSDGTSSLPPTKFDYNIPPISLYDTPIFSQNPGLILPPDSYFERTRDSGIRLIDFDADGYTDVLKKNSADPNFVFWRNNHQGWDGPKSIGPAGITSFTDASGNDQGVRIGDIDSDLKADLVQLKSNYKNIAKNNGGSLSIIQNNVPSDAFFIEEKSLTSSCAVDSCVDGAIDRGVSCSNGVCTRTCEYLACSSNSRIIKSGESRWPEWYEDSHQEFDYGDPVTPSPNKCYSFEYVQSSKRDEPLDLCYELDTDASGVDCKGNELDAYGGIGFYGYGDPSTWLRTVPSGNGYYGFTGAVKNGYWANVYLTTADSDGSPTSNGYWTLKMCSYMGGVSRQVIYCTPNALTCAAWDGRAPCGYGCANEPTRPYVVMGVYTEVSSRIGDAFNERWECGSTEGIYDNDYEGYGSYNVIEYDTETKSYTNSCAYTEYERKDNGVQMADVNGDGVTDFVMANTGTSMTWLGQEDGKRYVETAQWAMPSGYAFKNAQQQDTGLRLVDVNGDNLVDIIIANPYERRTWINTGNGWVQDPLWALPRPIVTSEYKPAGVEFAEVNGDGLIDIVYYEQGYGLKFYLNRGDGWTHDSSKSLPGVQFDLTSGVVQLVDLTSDGVDDVVYAEPGLKETRVSNSAQSFLLTKVTSPIGGTTNVQYKNMLDFDNTGDDDITDVSFGGWVVSSIESDNGMSGSHKVVAKTDYTYSDGYFSNAKREFRGFATVEEKDSDRTVRHSFRQDDVLKGNEYKTEVMDTSGSLLVKSENGFNVNATNGYYIVSLANSTTTKYSGGEQLSMLAKYRYDALGNVAAIDDLGDAAKPGDERYIINAYVYNTSAWIVDTIYTVQVLNSSRNRVRFSFYSYDSKPTNSPPSKGALSFAGQLHINGSLLSRTAYTYNSKGLVEREFDPLNRVTYYTYDTMGRLASIRNPLNHAATYAYDAAGNMISTTDANGITTSYQYDVFGRKTAEIQPLNDASSPTTQIIYDVDGSAPEGVTVKQLDNVPGLAASTIDTYSYIDGFGSTIQEKVESAEGDFVTKDTFYDSELRKSAGSNPYYSLSSSYTEPDSTAGRATIAYDSLGRITRITKPDSSTSSATYELLSSSSYDERGIRKDYLYDARDNIVGVKEYNLGNTSLTTYNYDSEGSLISITNSQGNTLSYEYDSLGRKVRMNDPDMGVWSYSYDAAGNLVVQSDARRYNITLAYDALNRLTAKNASYMGNTTYKGSIYGSTGYFYDVPTKGKLIKEWTVNSGTKSYEYDQRYRVVKETVNVASMNLATQYTYDNLDRVRQKTLPNGKTITYSYDGRGMMYSIAGIIDSQSYTAAGGVYSRKYSGSMMTNYDYNALTLRLERIATGHPNYPISTMPIETVPLGGSEQTTAVPSHTRLEVTPSTPGVYQRRQDLSYTYDAAGNVLKVEDMKRGTTEQFEYDDLERLTKAAKTAGNATQYNLSYAYSPIGNMLSILSGNYTVLFNYNPNYKPHAIASVVDPRLNKFPPVWGYMPNLTVAENRTIMVKPNVTDADGDPITVRYHKFVNDTGYWTPGFNTGTYNYAVAAFAYDGKFNVSKLFYINVTNVNRAPAWGYMRNLTIAENRTIWVFPNVTDADGDRINISYSRFINSTGLWTPNFTMGTYNYPIAAFAFDGKANISKVFYINVTNANRAPVWGYMPNLIVAENTTIRIFPNVTDADGDLITVRYSRFVNNTGYWKTNFTMAPWNYTIVAYAHDGKINVSKAFYISVLNTNRLPTWGYMPDLKVKAGQLVVITPNATDADGTALTFKYTPPINASGRWQTKNSSIGLYRTTITAFDGYVGVNKSLMINVTA